MIDHVSKLWWETDLFKFWMQHPKIFIEIFSLEWGRPNWKFSKVSKKGMKLFISPQNIFCLILKPLKIFVSLLKNHFFQHWKHQFFMCFFSRVKLCFLFKESINLCFSLSLYLWKKYACVIFILFCIISINILMFQVTLDIAWNIMYN